MKIVAIILAGLILAAGLVGIGYAGEIVLGVSSGSSSVGCVPSPGCYPNWWWNRCWYPRWNPCWPYYPYPSWTSSYTYETNSYYVDTIMY